MQISACLCFLLFYDISFDCCVGDASVVASITEAARATEVLLGPYTGEEYSKRVLVVRESRLNRAYASSVRLA